MIKYTSRICFIPVSNMKPVLKSSIDCTFPERGLPDFSCTYNPEKHLAGFLCIYSLPGCPRIKLKYTLLRAFYERCIVFDLVGLRIQCRFNTGTKNCLDLGIIFALLLSDLTWL